MRRRTIGTIAAGILALTTATTTAAAAASDEAAIEPSSWLDQQWCMVVENDNGVVAGQGCFRSWGDDFTAADIISDGLRVVTHWQTDYGRSGQCHNARGAISHVTCDGVNLAEHRKVRIRVTLRDGANGADQYSSGWSVWHPIG